MRTRLWGTSKNLLRRHLLNLRASLYTSKATFLSPIFAPLATVFRAPLWMLILAGLLGLASTAQAAKVSPQVAYGQQCAREIAKIPAFDCNAGTVVPITVDGKTPSEYKPGMKCDRPTMLPYNNQGNGQCIPYSKIHDLSDGATQISAFCRRKYLRSENSPQFDEVDIILHSVKTGKTCWFHAESAEGDNKGFDASRVPPPDEETPPPGKVSATQFWWPPKATAKKDCGMCHDADPFMFSPWLGQVWQKVPVDPLGKYSHVGEAFKHWKSSAMTTPNSTCDGCHRIGNKMSCTDNVIASAAGLKPIPGANQAGDSYPLNHWMPADNNQSKAFWNTVHNQTVAQLLECCKNPKSKNCTITPITTPAK